MKSHRDLWRTTIGLVAMPALAMGPLAPARATDAPTAQALWERQSVRLIAHDQPAPPNEHPATLSPEALATVLAALAVSGEPAFLGLGGGASKVFTDVEARVLAKTLATRLAEARPDQDVAFTVVGLRDAFFYLKEPVATGARAFIRDRRLNLIFGDLDQPSGRPTTGDGAKVEARLYPIRIGTRAGDTAHQWHLLPIEGQSLHAGPNGTRRDWITIDIPSSLAALGKGQDRLAETARETRAATRRIAREARQVGEETARMQQLLPRIRGGTGDPGPLSRRLATLEELRDKGVITPRQLARERRAMNRAR